MIKNSCLSAALWMATVNLGTANAGISDWTTVGDANWQEVDGVFQANAGNGFLVSKESYKDFELRLEFFPDSDTNSGVFLRCSEAGMINESNCYEVNIFDKRPDPTGRTGAIVNVAPPRVVIETEGKWNTYEISVQNTHLIVKLNGVVTVDAYDDKLHEGPIALQFAKGGIKFKKVNVRSGTLAAKYGNYPPD
jgi:hypothetical protein